jgi:hypothetical protein
MMGKREGTELLPVCQPTNGNPLSPISTAVPASTPDGTIASVRARSEGLEAVGGEEGCRRLSAAFYARVGRTQFFARSSQARAVGVPSKAFVAFLIQFLGGRKPDSAPMVAELAGITCTLPDWRRCTGRLAEAYGGTLDAEPLEEATRNAFRNFFSHSSPYLLGKDTASQIMKSWLSVGATSGFWIA